MICSYRHKCFPKLYVLEDELLRKWTVLLNENLHASIRLKLSPPFSAEAMNEGSYAVTFSIRLQGVHRDNITFTFIALLKIK